MQMARRCLYNDKHYEQIYICLYHSIRGITRWEWNAPTHIDPWVQGKNINMTGSFSSVSHAFFFIYSRFFRFARGSFDFDSYYDMLVTISLLTLASYAWDTIFRDFSNCTIGEMAFWIFIILRTDTKIVGALFFACIRDSLEFFSDLKTKSAKRVTWF